MQPPTLHVFVSSTWLDLQPERRAVETALQRLRELKFAGMEYFGSREDTPREVSLTEVDRCHLYIGILGSRYGSGITEAEYRRAVERGLARLVYCQAPAALRPEWQEADVDTATRLTALKELCREDTVSEFSSPEDLAARMTADLHRWLVDNVYIPAVEQARPSGSLQLPVPALPERLVARADMVARVKAALLGAFPPNESGAAATKVGLRGMGGCGKTVLATALARDPAVRARFRDGVMWLTVGEQADLLSLLGLLARSLVDSPPAFTRTDTGTLAVRGLLAAKSALLVLDDVWTKEQASALDVVGPGGGVLITTRNSAVLERVNATSHEIGELSDEEAAQLLARWTGRQGQPSPAIAAAIAAECGNLPLALAMAGALARQPARTWEDALEILKAANLEELEANFPDYPHRTLLAAIDAGIRDLPPDERPQYLELAAFGKEWVSKATLLALWGDSGNKLISHYSSRSLATLDDTETRLRLHDLQADYLRSRAGDPATIHRRVVDALRRRAGGSFAAATRGIDDGFFFQKVPYHLAAAGLEEELCQLLFDFHWLSEKLAVAGANALVADYALLPERSSCLLVAQALRLSAEALASSADQLAGQLLSRLHPAGDPNLERLLAAARAWGATATWLRPTRPGLLPAGGCLQQTFAGNTGGVKRISCPGDARQLLATCGDGAVRTWDLNSGTLVKTSRASGDGPLPDGPSIPDHWHERVREGIWFRCSWVALDQRRAAIGGTDGAHQNGRITVWDIQNGLCEQEIHCSELSGLAHEVASIAALDPWRIVTGSSPQNSICLWDLADGSFVRRFEAHTDAVTCLVRLDENHFASGSADETVRVWDVSPGALAADSARHDSSVQAVALTRGGAVSSGYDGRVLLWQLEGDAPPSVLAEDAGWVTVLVALDENRVAGGSVGGELRIWGLDPPRLVRELEGGGGWVQALARLDERRLVSGSIDGCVRVWDLRSGALLQALEGHTDRVTGLAAIEARYIASASPDHSIRIWDIDTGEQVRLVQDADWARVAVVDDFYVLFVTRPYKLRSWDWRTGESCEVWPQAIEPFSMRPHGRWISCVSGTGALLVLDVSARSCVAAIGPEQHDFRKDELVWLDRHHMVSGSQDHGVRVWNLSTGKCRASSFLDGPVKELASAPGTKLVVAGDTTGSVQVLAFEENGS